MFCNTLEFYFSLFNIFIHLTEEYTEELQEARDRLEPWTEKETKKIIARETTLNALNHWQKLLNLELFLFH